MIVPSTPTASDKTRELKELSDQISVLKATRDRAETETRLQVKTAQEIIDRIADLKIHLEELTASIPAVSAETKAFITYCADMIKETADDTKKVYAIKEAVIAETEKAIKTLVHFKKVAIDTHEETLRETILLDRQRDDLNIYYKRLEKYYKEHLPGQKIVI